MDEQKQPSEVNIGPTPDTSIPKMVKGPSRVSNKVIISLVAVIAVVSLGVTLFILLRPSAAPIPTEVIEPISSPVAALTLELTSPADGELAVNQEILVTGMTLPNTTVVIFTENDEVSVASDASGLFEGTITLADGINTLIVTAYGEEGEEKSVSLDIVYDAEGQT